MPPTFRAAVCAAVLFGAAPAFADDALYRELGAKPGLAKLTDDFTARLIADARVKAFFVDFDEAQFKTRLVDQLCEVSGGPCKYDGKDMRKVHSGFDIDRAAFNAVVEVLQQSMDAQGIAFRTQNRLLARLAPMHRDIVNVE
jgi:hemoglobin